MISSLGVLPASGMPRQSLGFFDTQFKVTIRSVEARREHDVAKVALARV